MLHFVSDEDAPRNVVHRLAEATAPGSLLVISHASRDGQPVLADSHQQLYARTATPMTMRSRDEIRDLFDGFDVIAPGVVPIQAWRPEPGAEVGGAPDRMVGFAGVGMKG